VRWKPEALSILENLPKKSLMEVKKRVERYVQDKGERDIWATTVYAAKPDIKLLYPIPFNANYEKHLGPVSAISCSPFHKRIFLSCSSDGAIRMYDVIDARPIAIFEPGYTEYLMCVAWSPFRPTVFAAVSNNGTLYIYDLIMSKQVPSYIIDYKAGDSDTGSKNKTAYAISFNPKQRDFLAVSYHDGTAKIFRLNYSLANV
jgi:WD40 repeat protein